MQNEYPINQELIEEMERLLKQAGVLNHLLPLPSGIVGSTNALHVLDLACGPGSWSMDVAQAHPDWHVTGLDISQRMIAFAQQRAKADQIENVTFMEGDALQTLPFADGALNYVHTRLIQGFVRVEMWPVLLAECMRVLRPGGYMQLVETTRPMVSGEVCTRINEYLAQGARLAGVSFSSDGHAFGLLERLAMIVQRAGFETEPETAHIVNFSAGRDFHDIWCENVAAASELLAGFIQKMEGLSDVEVAQLLADSRKEMAGDDFCGMSIFVSFIARKPE